MNLSDLRTLVRNLADESALARARASGMRARYERMRDAGTYGSRDVDYARQEAQDAAERAERLAREVEYGYTALADAEQAEHYAMLDSTDYDCL